jgi:hypothetical protein
VYRSNAAQSSLRSQVGSCRLAARLRGLPSRSAALAAERRSVGRREVKLCRAVLLVLALSSQLGCVTKQYASLPSTPQSAPVVSQCLSSLGFWEEPRSYNQFIDRDPHLVAVWSMPTRSRTSNAPGTTVWVENRAGRWQLRFLPGVEEDNAGTATLARSFERCMAERIPGVEVTLTSTTTPDFR